MRTGSFREVFDRQNGRAPLPEVPLAGWARLDRMRIPGLEEHSHPTAFEFFLIERGRVEWWVEDEIHHVSARHLYINRPGERHGSLGRGLKPCGYLWFQLALGDVLPGLAPADSARLVADIRAIHSHSFAASSTTRSAFRAFWQSHRESMGEHQVLELRSRLHLLLISILRDHAAATLTSPAPLAAKAVPHPPRASFTINRALQRIDSRPTEVGTVAELAASLNLGVTRFAERFYGETGFTPAHYLRIRRIEFAKQLMHEGGRTLTEIAHASGHASGQHFATVFKRMEGVTPSAYLRQLQSGFALPAAINFTP